MAKAAMYDGLAAGPSASSHPDARPKARISGSIPGALDSTQSQRLCRDPGSRLSFASFDPHTASSTQEIPDIRKLSLNEELYRPKRVVIETTSTGESFWRFVPSARRDEGVPDEGTWPRVVEICGRLYECSQDQWDIYKLDPLYDCHVRAYPNLTMISRISDRPKPIFAPKVGDKRLTTSPSSDVSTRPSSPRKKVHMESETSSDEEQGEVEEMIVDDRAGWSGSKIPGFHKRAKVKEEISKNRKERREKMARRTEQLTKAENEDRTPCIPETQPIGKRKITLLFESLRSNGHRDVGRTCSVEDEAFRSAMNYVPSQRRKRTRTVSPASAKRDLEAKRLSREKKKQERQEQEMRAWRQERDSRFLREVLNEVPEPEIEGAQGTDDDEEEGNPDAGNAMDNEEASHNAAIEESRRKLAELEADRPLWEAAAARRRQEELAEELRAAERRAAATAKAEQEKQKRKEAERIAREEAEMRERDERARRDKEKRQRQSWLYGKWSQQRAMERYLELSQYFDETKFSPQYPLTIDAVPWPVLHSPKTFSVEDVTWQAVEEFFGAFQSKMRTPDFKTLVEKSHRRFHPDRWRSRSLLTSVGDETERECMEVAANTVAQALTPMWQRLRAVGRN